MQRFMAESCDEVIYQLLRIPSHGNLKGYVREMCPQQPLFQRHVAVHLQTAGKLCHLRACFAMQLYHLEPAVSSRFHPAHHRHTEPFIHASSRLSMGNRLSMGQHSSACKAHLPLRILVKMK